MSRREFGFILVAVDSVVGACWGVPPAGAGLRFRLLKDMRASRYFQAAGYPSLQEALFPPASLAGARSKVLLAFLLVCLWLLVYFGCQRAGGKRARLLRPGLLDRLVPLWEWSLPLYLLAYVYPLALLGLATGRELLRIAAAYALLILSSGGAFLLYPTRIKRIEEPKLSLLRLLYRLDGSGNCLPSLHTGSALLTTCFLYNFGPLYFAAGLGCTLAISISSLCIRQHYLIDVLSGCLLAVLVFALAVSA